MTNPENAESPPECECFVTPEHMWLSAASCGYGSGYEPGSQMEWNPDCPAHPPAKPVCNCSASNPFKAHGADPAHCPVHGEPTRILPPAECRACRIQACEIEGNTAEPHTCEARA